MGDDQVHTGSEEYHGQESQAPEHTHYAQNQHAFASQLDITTPSPGNNGRQGAFNMSAMANSLPQNGGFRPGPGYPPTPQQQQQQQQQQQRFSPNHMASPPMMQHMANHYVHSGTVPNQHYYMAQMPPGQPYYGNSMSPTQQPARPNMGYYPNQMIMGGHSPNHMHSGYYYNIHGGPNYPQQHQSMSPVLSNGGGQFFGHGMPGSDPKMMPQSPVLDGQFGHLHHGSEDATDGKSRIVRGPPRKPKQSGHAIWIGNLPPQTDLMSLVHHVCKEAAGLESLFLISKSNCAFANFKDEPFCTAAQQKLHDSKFQTVRLVSRLRKSTVEGAAGITAPTGPAATTEIPALADKPSEPEASDASVEQPATESSDSQRAQDGESPTQKDRFFILKSLTTDDLELSVRTGIWATQSHNEESLNKAFGAADNVYLVFSANKSGEYFGYARMTSPINEDPKAAIEFAPKVSTSSDVDLPKAIPTEATEFAPKGRIIDDSARGTIFWEAEREDGDNVDEEESDADSNKAGDGEDGTTTKTWGKPFKLEWLSTARLPFYRTRGLRNPWNSNREVKIARDGTELETSVGRRLVGLFNRVHSPVPGHMPQAVRPGMMMPAYAVMRPYS